MKLIDSDLQQLVIGTDDEKAMVKAIKTAFPGSTHVLCSRHLKQNAIHKLTDDAVSKADRNIIVDKLFGEEGIVNADDTICLGHKCETFATYCADKSEKFLKYFDTRLKCQLKTKLNEPARQEKIETDWTNNNSESMNHVLKQATDWKKKSLTEIVQSIEDVVDGKLKELRAAMIGTGEFRLAETHRQFRLSKTKWVTKDTCQRNRAYSRFRNFVPKHKKLVTSTDGQCSVVGPRTLGKKPKQNVRRPKTVTVKCQPKHDVSDSD